MSVKTAIPEKDGLHFITFTCQGWLPLFDVTNSYDLVYKWFDYLKGQGHFICGYVIMPNHLHVLLGFRQANKSINTLVSNGKRFMAYELVTRLQARRHGALLQQLAEAVSPSDARPRYSNLLLIRRSAAMTALWSRSCSTCTTILVAVNGT